MVSLLDIAPSSVKGTTTKVRGIDVDVRGVSIADVAWLIKSFPEVKDVFAGKDVEFSFETLLDRAPELVYGVIACGIGDPNARVASMKAAVDLTIEEQVAALAAIFGETFKGGVGPFVEQVTRLFGVASDVGSKVLASN